MGKSISRKNVDYFGMFEKSAAIARDTAYKLQSAFRDGNINLAELRSLKELEHAGDLHLHECMKIIDVAFITPIDRTDLAAILNGIENVTDSIEDIADSFYMMCINESNECMRRFVTLLALSCEKMLELMTELKRFKKNVNDISKLIIEINRIEEEGDKLFRDNMRNLFEFETNPMTVIKYKDLYRRFEDAVDCCEDVADMVENIIVTKT